MNNIRLNLVIFNVRSKDFYFTIFIPFEDIEWQV